MPEIVSHLGSRGPARAAEGLCFIVCSHGRLPLANKQESMGISGRNYWTPPRVENK